MLVRKFVSFSLFVLGIVFGSATALQAFSPESFSVEKLKAAQEANQIIIVDVAAKWCPTCKGQHKDLEALLKDEKYKGVVTFAVDFDDKDQVKALGEHIGRPVPRQSTIVFFKGKDLVGFSVAERGDKLKAHLDKAY